MVRVDIFPGLLPADFWSRSQSLDQESHDLWRRSCRRLGNITRAKREIPQSRANFYELFENANAKWLYSLQLKKKTLLYR